MAPSSWAQKKGTFFFAGGGGNADFIFMGARFSLREEKGRQREGGKKEKRTRENRSGLPKVPQNAAEPVGFCKKVLQNVSHCKKFVSEKLGFCRTWEPNPAFQALQILLACKGPKGIPARGWGKTP